MNGHIPRFYCKTKYRNTGIPILNEISQATRLMIKGEKREG